MIKSLIKNIYLKLKTASMVKVYWWFWGCFYFFALLRVVANQLTLGEAFFYMFYPFTSPFSLKNGDLSIHIDAFIGLLILPYIANLTLYDYYNRIIHLWFKKIVMVISLVARICFLIYMSFLAYFAVNVIGEVLEYAPLIKK